MVRHHVVDLEEIEGMNMTPMIDVVFQLIIFFMLVMDMSRQQLTPLKLPTASKAEKEKFTDETQLILNVRDNGEILIGGKLYFRPPQDPTQYEARKLEDLFEARRQIRAYQEVAGDANFVKYPILVRADRSAPFQWVQMILMIATLHGGVTQVSLGAMQDQVK
ncbi:MAG: biopolymer transporter ExbD [Planctomycetes bacterium]|nr:biopolymer transporter ExbD [Planctomycetota bacterium]